MCVCGHIYIYIYILIMVLQVRARVSYRVYLGDGKVIKSS